MWNIEVLTCLVFAASRHAASEFLCSVNASDVESSEFDEKMLFLVQDSAPTAADLGIAAFANTTAESAADSSNGDKCNIEWELYVKMICVPFFTLMGLIGNTLSFLVMFSPLYKRKSYSYYLRALAVSDNLMLIITCVDVANEVSFELAGLRLLDNHNSVTCKLSKFLSNVVSLVSSWLIVCFTIDRYIAVCHPLQRARVCTASSARNSIIIVVLIAMASQIYVFFFIEHMDGRNKPQLCHAPSDLRVQYYQLDYFWFSFSLRFLAPFLVVAICNGRIIFHVKRTRQTRPRSYEWAKRCRSSNMAICTLYVVCAVFVATLCPNAIISVILMADYLIYQRSVMSELYCELLRFNTPFQMMRLINYSVNFVLYGLSGRQFRREACKLLRCRMRMRGLNDRTQGVATQKGYVNGFRSPVMKHFLVKPNKNATLHNFNIATVP